MIDLPVENLMKTYQSLLKSVKTPVVITQKQTGLKREDNTVLSDTAPMPGILPGDVPIRT